MKKLIQILLVLVVSVALIFGLLQFTHGSSLAGGGNTTCRVGWNTKTGTCLAGIIRLPGDGYMPNVGWNS